jgi:hypothetical protein
MQKWLLNYCFEGCTTVAVTQRSKTAAAATTTFSHEEEWTVGCGILLP